MKAGVRPNCEHVFRTTSIRFDPVNSLAYRRSTLYTNELKPREMMSAPASTLSTSSLSNRRWPTPSRTWLMRMKWHDLLFMHWPVDEIQIQNHLPKGLKVDLFEGQAWIGIVPFWMSGVGIRWTPSLPYLSRFPELNVRTYVTINGKPGVWFFSLDATNPMAVRGARYLFHLPYMDAKIKVSREADWIQYSSDRTHRGEPSAKLDCEYRPLGCPYEAEPGSLAHWLTARYCMYMSNSRSQIFRGEIDHGPWQLRDAQAIVRHNSMTDWLGIDLPKIAPICHFSSLTKVQAWGKERVFE